jgi:hypothetical protein
VPGCAGAGGQAALSRAALSDVPVPTDTSFPGLCSSRWCARFGSHLLSPHVTSGVPAAAGVLMVEPIGAICRQAKGDAPRCQPGTAVLSLHRFQGPLPAPGGGWEGARNDGDSCCSRWASRPQRCSAFCAIARFL